DRREASFWVCSGAATAVDKPSFESNCLPARVTYASTVIPDEILLAELYHFLAHPAGPSEPAAPRLPAGKLALLVESGSGYGSAVSNIYGTRGKGDRSHGVIAIPFPSQISQVRASTLAAGDSGALAGASGKRVTIPF